MIRTLDPTPFNAIGEHPEVRPWIGIADPKAAVDFAPIVANPANICILTDDGRSGGYMLIRLGAGLYAAHTLAIPSEAGGQMKKLMRRGFRFMFTATDCVEIVTHVPGRNMRAARWADLAGFREIMVRPGAMSLMGELVDVSVRTLGFMDWALAETNNAAAGRHLHGLIEAATGGLDHPHDEAHDRMLGAAAECAGAGQIEKGVILYNRWALMAGYAKASLVSVNPPLVDIGKAMLQLMDGRFDALAKPAPATPQKGEQICRPAQVSPQSERPSRAES